MKNKEETSLDEDLQELMKLRAVTIRNGKYVYHPEFVKTVEHIRRHPPSKFRQMRVAGSIGRRMKTLLISTAAMYHTRRDVENLITAYFCLEEHLKRLKLKVSNKRKPWLAYALWYLNDHEVEVLDEDK